MNRPVYLDHHATTPADSRVVTAMQPWWTKQCGNAGSLHHAFGREAHQAVEQGRLKLARLLNCEPESVIFTSGATEANNLALRGFLGSQPQGTHAISTVAEHHAVLDPLRKLQRRGVAVTWLTVDGSARVDPEQVLQAITPQTRLVSIMLANNEVGSLNPLRDICDVCHARGVVVHTDATQAVGQIPVDLQALPVDFLSLSGHKFYGPKGIGALIVQEREIPLRIDPLQMGGGQERGLRSGTLPVPLIVGLGEAAGIARLEGSQHSASLASLRDDLWLRLEHTIPDLLRNTPLTDVLPHNLNFSVLGVNGDQLLPAITEIALSSGSACSTTERNPSHVLQALGRSQEQARASLRLGLGRSTSQLDIQFVAKSLEQTIRQLRMT